MRKMVAVKRMVRAVGVTSRGWRRVVGRCGLQEGRQGSMVRAVLRNRVLSRRGACLGTVERNEDSRSNLE